ncbi:endophilin-A3b isoform X2 [Sander lucioperca]|uniref:endophilin-A3b isoform X2 n=1 Tax=Sander lucioperca TaxID=283035 RepID=UPI00165345B5|nr:endophilin-A3b isoform X2 [Sander lucioperca]
MSVSGMKKQLHKASQLLNERLMGAEGTKMDDDFLKMEKSVEVLQSLLVELLSRTTEFLQPHPGGALAEAGEALQQVAQARHALDGDIKRSFIGPLEQLQNTELKEIQFQLKKLNGRRLDFDYKRRRRGKVPAQEVQRAWDKFLLSKELVERSMFVLLQSDVDQLSRLAALVAALLDFHRNAHRILLGLHGNLQARLTASSNRPERRFRPKKIRVRNELNGSFPSITRAVPSGEQLSALPSRPSSPISCYADSNLILDQPCCRAMYSFRPSHAGELSFSEGDVIVLTNQVDANWFEGTLAGQSGLFPVSYVDVLVPLPLP